MHGKHFVTFHILLKMNNGIGLPTLAHFSEFLMKNRKLTLKGWHNFVFVRKFSFQIMDSTRSHKATRHFKFLQCAIVIV